VPAAGISATMPTLSCWLFRGFQRWARWAPTFEPAMDCAPYTASTCPSRIGAPSLARQHVPKGKRVSKKNYLEAMGSAEQRPSPPSLHRENEQARYFALLRASVRPAGQPWSYPARSPPGRQPFRTTSIHRSRCTDRAPIRPHPELRLGPRHGSARI